MHHDFPAPATTSRLACLLLLAVIIGGCMSRSTTVYHVAHDGDSFSETVDGRTIHFANWQLNIGDAVIDIPHEKATIVIRHNGSHVHIEVNDKVFYED